MLVAFRLDLKVYQWGLEREDGQHMFDRPWMSIAHLLRKLSVGEDVIQGHIELAQIVLSRDLSRTFNRSSVSLLDRTLPKRSLSQQTHSRSRDVGPVTGNSKQTFHSGFSVL